MFDTLCSIEVGPRLILDSSLEIVQQGDLDKDEIARLWQYLCSPDGAISVHASETIFNLAQSGKLSVLSDR